MINILPSDLSRLVADGATSEDDPQAVRIPLLVDLFKPSKGPKFGVKAFELHNKKLTLEQIAKTLGILKRSAHIAKEYGKAMSEAGITDPYIELTQPPTNASRWR